MDRNIDSIYLNPCCIHKHLGEYLERRQPTSFFANSDWGLSRFLELLSLYVPGGEMTLCLPVVSDEIKLKLQSLLNSEIIGKLNVIHSGNTFLFSSNADRITVASYPIGFRTLALSNDSRTVVVSGSFNQQRMEVGMQLQHFILCTDKQTYQDTMSALIPILRIHAIKV